MCTFVLSYPTGFSTVSQPDTCPIVQTYVSLPVLNTHAGSGQTVNVPNDVEVKYCH